MQRSKYQQKVLLDTHTWIWINTAGIELSAKFKKFICEYQKTSLMLISPISLWEIGMLVEKKRLGLSISCKEWVQKAILGLRIAPITPSIAILSSNLPDKIHGDPADRLILATAIHRKAILATADAKLIDFCNRNSLAYINPTKK